MSDFRGLGKQAMTLAEWRALDLSRPLTDPALGGSVSAQRRRQICAELSDLVTERVGFVPSRKNSKQGGPRGES